MDHVKRIAQHFRKVAGHHHKIATAVEKCTEMTKAVKTGKALDVDKLEELLAQLLESHSAIGDECGECAEDLAECSKADGRHTSVFRRDDLEDLPQGLTKINPPKAIPREGQPAVRAAATDPQFSKLLALTEEEMHVEETTLRK